MRALLLLAWLLFPRLLFPRLLIAGLVSPGVAIDFPARIFVAPVIVAAIVVALGLVAIEGRAHFVVLLGRLAEQAAVVLGMLKEALSRDAVAGELGVTRQSLIFVDDLLRRATNLAVRAGAFENSIDNITKVSTIIIVIAIVHISGVVPHATRLVPGS